ncbi:MAG: protease inhibitor I42 family protein [Pelosinus sp.]|nr:protease inhibitor I42 family protein [Pelosinus sp.]
MKKSSLVVALMLVMLLTVIGAAAAEEQKADNYAVVKTVEVNGRSGEIASQEVTVKPGDYIKVNLYAAGGTGYDWQLDSDSADSIQAVSKDTAPVGDKYLAGGPVRWEFVLLVKPEAKPQTLHFALVRSWEKNKKPAQAFDLKVLLAETKKAAAAVKIIKSEYQAEGSKLFFPQVSGMADGALQSKINDNLKTKILSLNNPSPDSAIHGDFEVSFYNGILLGIHFRGDSFTLGTAHPNKIDCGIHIDLTTGEIYNIEDLFVKDVDFAARIKEICLADNTGYRIKLKGLWDGWSYDHFASSWGGTEKNFLLGNNAIRVYTIPNDTVGAISGYSVLYADLIDIIDTHSEFWKKITSKGSEIIEKDMGDFYF